MLVSVPAFAETFKIDGFCSLITELKTVFNLLRMMAFVGAAFYIANWAYEYIKAGEAKGEEIKKKGMGLLVGFALLFSVGLILSFINSTVGRGALGCGIDQPW